MKVLMIAIKLIHTSDVCPIHGHSVMCSLSIIDPYMLIIITTITISSGNDDDNKPIHPVLDVSLLGLYLLFFDDFLVRQPIKSWSCWGVVWILFLRQGNISLAGAWPSKRRQPTTFSSKMNTTSTKTFTSEWVLFGRLIITM